MPQQMSKLVTVFGGSGFVGRYIVQRLAHDGWRVRVAVRRPNEALFTKTYGNVGQVEPIFCNIRDDKSVRAATAGAEAVVNCVGTFDARGRNNFDAVQNEGAARIARIAAEEGVVRMVHLSAIGADENSNSLYGRSKALGEKAVLQHMPGAMILRPSVIFGIEDKFFNRFGTMAVRSPVLPVVGAGTKFQPVFVDDVAAAAEKGVLGTAPGGIYELGGPHVSTFRELMGQMLKAIERRRAVVSLPFSMAAWTAWWLDLFAMFGLPNNTLTRDQVRQLRVDNVVSGEQKTFADLGIEPHSTAAILPVYMWRHRTGGQFTSIRDSARNLRA